MLQPPTSPEVLAHWRYAPDQWREFVNCEAIQYEKRLKSARVFIIVVSLITVLAVTLLLAVPLGLGFPWREDVYGPPIAVIVIAVLLLTVGGAVWASQRHKLSLLRNSTGDVFITLDGVNTNGVWFGWKREVIGWRLRHIGRKTISVGSARSMEVLEFKCAAYNSHSLNRRVVKAWRIPIPPGKEIEADRIIERLFAGINFLPEVERNEPAQPFVRHDSEKNILGHVFIGDVCRQCGSSVDAVMNFKWECKE